MRTGTLNKKATTLVYQILINIIIVLLASTLFIILATRMNSHTDLLTRYYAEDLQLTIEAIQAVPGDMMLRYHLDEGFTASFEEEKLTITSEENDKQTRSYHTLGAQGGPRITIEPATVEGLFEIRKADGKITIEKPSYATYELACPQVFVVATQNPGVSIATYQTPTTDAQAQADLKALHTTIERSLDKVTTNGADTSLLIDIQLHTLSENEEEKSHLIFERPEAIGTEETNYRAIFCSLVQQLDEYPIGIKEVLTDPQEPYAITLQFALHEEDRKAVLVTRADLAEALATSIAALGGDTP